MDDADGIFNYDVFIVAVRGVIWSYLLDSGVTSHIKIHRHLAV